MSSRASPACHAWLLWDANGSGDPVIWGFEMKGKPGHALPTWRVFNTFTRDAEFQHGLQEPSRSVAFSSILGPMSSIIIQSLHFFLPENRASASFLNTSAHQADSPCHWSELVHKMKLVLPLGGWSSRAGPCSQEDVDQNFLLCACFCVSFLQSVWVHNSCDNAALGFCSWNILAILLGNLLKIKYQ